MGQTLNLKNGSKILASIRIITGRTSRPLVPNLHDNTVRFVGLENGEIYFQVMNQAEFDLTLHVLNTNNDKLTKSKK